MTTINTFEERAKLRRIFRDKRNTLLPQQQQEAAKRLVQAWKNIDFSDSVKNVGLYLSNDGELNTQALIEYFWSQNINVYLPVLHPFTKGYLLFLKYTPSTHMHTNKFGILEPKLDVTQVCTVQNLDIIFTPLVAFDEKGNRLGMGGGFYDRTLQALQPVAPENKPALHTHIIGLAHDIQKTLSLPIETWDIPLSAILTPTQFYTFDRKST